MIQELYTIINKRNLHNPEYYELNALDELPIIKQLFKSWIENESIIPMAIRPFSEFLDYQRIFIKYMMVIRDAVDEDSFNEFFKEVLKEKSKYEDAIQRKWDSIMDEIEVVRSNSQDNPKKIQKYADYETEQSVISIKTKFDSMYNLSLIENLLFGLASIEENKFLRENSNINITLIDKKKKLTDRDMNEIMDYLKTKGIESPKTEISNLRITCQYTLEDSNLINIQYGSAYRPGKFINLEEVLNNKILSLNDNHRKYAASEGRKGFRGYISVHTHPMYNLNAGNFDRFYDYVDNYFSDRHLQYPITIHIKSPYSIPGRKQYNDIKILYENNRIRKMCANG